MSKDYQIRVFTTEKGKKIYVFISLRNINEKQYTYDELMQAVARFKHDKIGTHYKLHKATINSYKEGLDGLWFYPYITDYNHITCWALWNGDL